MSDLRPYPEYKDSGLPWLGRVPAHWDVIRTKGLFGLSIEKSEAQHGMELLSIYTHIGVRPRKDLEERGNKASTTDGYWIVRKGDLIVNKLLAWMGAVGVSHYEGVTSPAYDILRPRRTLNSDYYHYLFRTGTYLQQFKSRSRGIMDMRLRLYFDQLGQIPSLAPPHDEQNAIVAYLDDVFRKTNKFIRNRRRLIEVLNEQKQAIINRAVTRGLPSASSGQATPNAPLKPSGIDWLGEIPEHWQTRRLKFLVRNVNEQTSTRQPHEVYIALEHIEGWTGRINLPSENIEFDSQVKRFRPGDVLFGKLRPYLAKVTRPDMPGVCVGEFLVLRGTDEGLLPKFLEQELRSKRFIDIINSSTFGAKMPRADWTFIGNLVIVYPPTHAEQSEILTEIGRQTASLQTAIDTAKREIDLIREYRTRLIADVVTGKADVRGLAPAEPLPADEQIDEGIDDEEMPADGEPELVEEAADADD